jgi:hypothetical protein
MAFHSSSVTIDVAPSGWLVSVEGMGDGLLLSREVTMVAFAREWADVA